MTVKGMLMYYTIVGHQTAERLLGLSHCSRAALLSLTILLLPFLVCGLHCALCVCARARLCVLLCVHDVHACAGGGAEVTGCLAAVVWVLSTAFFLVAF